VGVLLPPYVGVVSIDTIVHGQEVLTNYSRGHWANSQLRHPPEVVARAVEFYNEMDSPDAVFVGVAGDDVDLAALDALVASDLVGLQVRQAQGLVTVLESDCHAFRSDLGSAVFYYDTGASISICSDGSFLSGLVELPRPLHLGGIGAGISVTHRGYLKFLPPHLGLCYFSVTAGANLISLGFLQQRGGMYASVDHGERSQMLVTDTGGVQLDLVPLGINRLSRVSPQIVQSVWSSSLYADAVRWSSVAPLGGPDGVPVEVSFPVLSPSSDDVLDDQLLYASVPPLPLDSMGALFACSSQAWACLADDLCDFVDSPIAAYPTLQRISSMQRPHRFEHYSAEQRSRCDRVQVVHSFIHMGDDALCRALD
jgi:hypothetical protein